MSNVTKIFGPPGTGKTTRLLNIVEEAMRAGVKPERIAYMAFTRKAADEAAERAKQRFGFVDEQLPWFRTLHSMAFKHLFARRDDIMQEDHYKQLGFALGFQFTTLDDEFSMMPAGTALGDRVARIEALSRVRNVSLEHQWTDSNFRDVPWKAVEQWSDALRQYKDSRGMMDYTDLLEQYDAALDVDLFIIDEAQDLSPLQWKVVRTASASAKHKFAAGDDDQCIYGWAGADVGIFLRLRATPEVLPHSFRLPRTVQALAETVTQGIEQRQSKQWTAREEDGDVRQIRSEQLLDLSQGTWLLLARNRRFLSRYVRVLEDSGYPYMRDGHHSTDTADVKALKAWERWRRGHDIDPPDVKALSQFLPVLDGWQPKEAVGIGSSPVAEETRKLNWMDALDIQPRRREYLRACLANREKLDAKPRITVSTIHRVKGGEAEHVALIPDLSMQPWQQRNGDDELRVLYVALTRAKQTLTLITPQSNKHYTI